MTTYYRYEFYPYEHSYGGGELCLRTFVAVKKTPKGAWIVEAPYGIKKRFVLDSGRKKFAYQDIKQALDSYIARKRRQITLLTYQLENAQSGLAAAKEKRNADNISTEIPE